MAVDELEQRRQAAADGGDTDDTDDAGVQTGAEALGEGAVETGDPNPDEPEAVEEPKPPKLLQEALPGLEAAISSAFGGSDPEVSEIRLLGGKMPIDGSFPKGTELDLIVRVRVTGVLGQDLEDAYGTKKHTVRRHFARMISVRRVSR
jgi:hypothetical protein